jgi:hypothetical protein
MVRLLGGNGLVDGAGWRRGVRIAAVVLFLACVGSLTVAGSLRPELAGSLAASPARLSQGKVWLLISSGLLAEHPLGASIVSFVLLALLALVVCGSRRFWWAAVCGHVGSTIVVYAAIWLVRLSHPHAFSSVFWSPDYGVSAISAAWLGAIAAVGWRIRGRSQGGRAAIALSCIAVGLFAYTARPGITIIAAEHLLAFAFGILVAVVSPGPGRAIAASGRFVAANGDASGWFARLVPRPIRSLDPLVLVTFVTAAVVVAGSAMPSAVAALGEAIARPNLPSAAGCASAWNHSLPEHLLELGNEPVLVAPSSTRVMSAAGRRVRLDFCAYVFPQGRDSQIAVVGRWRDGRIADWRSRTAAPDELPTNAVASPTGKIELGLTHHPRRG